MGRFECREATTSVVSATVRVLTCILLVLSVGSCGPTAAPVTGPDAGFVLTEGIGGNQPPSFQFLAPTESLILDQGSILPIEFIDDDPDTNALVSLELDPDLAVTGDEFVLFSNCSEDTDGESSNRFQCPVGGSDNSTDRFLLDTSVVPTGTYQLVGRINDELNPEVVTVAGIGGTPLLIQIVEPGLSPANSPPSIKVTAPTLNVGVGTGDQLVIEWEDADEDSNANLFIFLDFNNDSTDDDFTDPNDPGLILLGVRSEDADPFGVGADGTPTDQTSETPPPLTPVDLDNDGIISPAEEFAPCLSANRLCVRIDIDKIPIRKDGEPFFIRITATDGVNQPIHAYAPGTVRVLTFSANPVVDLAQVGKTITGAVFQGFNEGANTGSELLRAGDWDIDGTDDAMIVAQFGSPLGRTKTGQAWMLYGIQGQRLAGVTNVNEIGSNIRGTVYSGRSRTFPGTATDNGTLGLTSVDVVPDVTGDGHPELLFGMPFISGLEDVVDTDPSDGTGEYLDGLPANICDTGAADALGGINFDPFLNQLVVLDSGYAFFMSGNSAGVGTFDNVAVDIGLIGQSVPEGTRFRGAWFDRVLTGASIGESTVTVDTHFGQTVSSLPDLTSFGANSPSVSVRFKDGSNEILVSAPFGLRNDIDLNSEFEPLLSSNTTDRPGKIFLMDGATGEDGNPDAYEDSNDISSVPTFLATGIPCVRAFGYNFFLTIVGEQSGDEFGWGVNGGDFNQDGSTDILCGAPRADRAGKTDSGILYILLGSLTIGSMDLSIDNPPRVEIHGDNFDQLGRVHNLIDDFDGGSIEDIAFGIPFHDSNLVADSGMAGIVLGGQLITGENIFSLDEIATFQLPGLIIEGEFANQRFGTSVASAGDFNGDGLGDVVITAPGEIRSVNGQLRRGVVYLVFGSDQVINRRFVASQIGTAFLPGKVFISPYQVGTLDEAAPIMAKGVGDIDGDGFDDIMIGNPDADFVDPAAPTQRRTDSGEVYLVYGNNL